MQFWWRGNESLASYDEWRSKIAAKADAPGRSARSLAMSWAGPICLAGALSQQAKLRDLRVETASVEAQTAFDSFAGGKRNHDLLLTGSAGAGRVVISIESKADEPFGQTVERYLADGKKLKTESRSTNAPERIAGLVNALATHRSLADTQVLRLRYQLLSGLAGAIAAAVELQASACVFLIREFVTDRTTEALRQKNATELYNPGATVFDREFPLAATPPWCIGPLPFAGDTSRLCASVDLYVAKATTDWRTQTSSG